MIRSLTVKNFKSWESIGPLTLGTLTGLFGPNSAGKSSLFQLLLMLKQTAESSDRAQVLNLGDDRSSVTLGIFDDIIFSHEADRSLHFTLSLSLPSPLRIADPEKKSAPLFVGNELEFEVEIEQTAGGRLSVRALTYGFSDHRFSMVRKGVSQSKYQLSVEGVGFKFKRTPGRVWDLPAPFAFMDFPTK